MVFSLNKRQYLFVENTKLLVGNDHVIDVFTSEDIENISLRVFSILLSTIIIMKVYPAFFRKTKVHLQLSSY